MAESSWQPMMSAAQRRRQRRLRSWWRHEQQSIAAALATSQHHSALRGQKKARAGGGPRDELHGHDVPVPLMGEQLVEVYKLLDVMVPEQVIAVPKIFVDDIPPRRLVRDPQLAEQLVAVPTPSPALAPVPRMEHQLVEVPPVVPQLVPFFAGDDGYVWRQLSGPTGAYWWRVGSSHTQWAPPPGYTARPGRYTNTGRRDAG